MSITETNMFNLRTVKDFIWRFKPPRPSGKCSFSRLLRTDWAELSGSLLWCAPKHKRTHKIIHFKGNKENALSMVCSMSSLCVGYCRTHSDGLVQRPLEVLLELCSDLDQVDFTARNDDPGHHLLLRSFTLRENRRRRRRCYVSFQVETLDKNMENSPSWLHWVCWRSTAACFQSTPLWTNDTQLLNASCYREVEFQSYFVLMASISFNVWLKMKQTLALVLGFPVKPGLNLWLEYWMKMFLRRTQSEERLLQISLHLLPDALLHVVGAVALIPLKHWHTTHTLKGQYVRLSFKHKLCFFTTLVSFKYTNIIPYYFYICLFHGSYFVGFITFPVVWYFIWSVLLIFIVLVFSGLLLVSFAS